MRSIITIAMLAAALTSQAQGLHASGNTVEELVPQGWTHQEATGDLNKDGVADMVVLATPNFKENIRVREDGYEYNFNPHVLAVYFGSGNGTFALWKKYEDIMPHAEAEGEMYEYSLNITDKGVLRIGISLWMSMGGWGTSSADHVYRYQDGDFYLIGNDFTSLQRNTGEREEVSCNYLTWKRQHITDNEFDKKVKKREKWSKLKKHPLKRLGEEELELWEEEE